MVVSGVADLVGRVLADRYRLLAPIGSGASGRVYVAHDVRLRRRVAVKVLHTALADDAGFLRRFRAEAQVAASLHHPNIMAAYDWGEDDVPFMVLELLEGGSLRGMLDHDRRLSPAQAAHVGSQVAAALDYAHARGLVHRDVKPANLLFDEHGIVRVADFGLARALAEASWTEPAGAVLGTTRYAAPEQGGGAPLDGRADLYSLALVLVEAITGRVPFVADTPLGTLAARARRPIAAPAALGPLGAVVERAGRPDPADRYPDAATMEAALADAEAALPPAGPLALAGIGRVVDDPNPTQLPRSRRGVFDQDAADDIDVIDEIVVVEPVPRRDRHPVNWVGLVVAAVVVAALVGAVVTLLRAPGAAASVPNLVGTSQERAAQIAQRAGLGITVRQRAASDPKGAVIEQDPSPGRWRGDGEAVVVYVSRGPKPVTFGDLAGQSADAATARLQQLGFAVDVSRRHDETVPADVVIASIPKGGAPPDSVVKLVVSDGPAPVTVPDNLAGKSYEDAAAAVAAAKLQPARRDDFNDTVPVGQVIGTEPGGGQSVPRDSTVTVVVSKGPDLVAVPPVAGHTIEDASNTLAANGLQVSVQGNYAPGRPVIASDPAAGTKVHRGATVRVFL